MTGIEIATRGSDVKAIDIEHARAALPAVLATTFPGEDIGPPTVITGGNFNATFGVAIGGRASVARINPDPDAYAIEVAAYRHAVDAGMPVPEILAWQPRVAALGASLLVLRAVPGEPLGSASLTDAQRLARHVEAGVLLRRLHQRPLAGYGMLTVRDDELGGASVSPRDYWLRDNPWDRDLESISREGPVSPSEWRAVAANIAMIADLSFGPARLLHNDYHGAHLFTDGERITGVIDFGNALAGDPRYDIAMAMHFSAADERAAFIAGYGEPARDPLVDAYAIHIAAIKILWIQRFGNPGRLGGAHRVLQDRLRVRR